MAPGLAVTGITGVRGAEAVASLWKAIGVGVYAGKVNIRFRQLLTGDPAYDFGRFLVDLAPW